jgi:CheY-like chemotaxis protein
MLAMTGRSFDHGPAKPYDLDAIGPSTHRRSAGPRIAPKVVRRSTGEVCTILIVDDDVDTREALADNLGGEGHSVLLAMNGCHALELLELGRSMGVGPCLALVDLTMPVMDGWALLAALDRDGSWRKLQVIVSSGSDLSQRPLSFAHAIAVWPKPIDLNKLRHIQDRCPIHGFPSRPAAQADPEIALLEDVARVVGPRSTESAAREPAPRRAGAGKAGRQRGARHHRRQAAK